MWRKNLCCLCLIVCVFVSNLVHCRVQNFQTKDFKVGVEYEHSLPMAGGSDRYRHRNNYDPFFVTVNVTARNDYVLTYVEVAATVDEEGDVEFYLRQGQTGSKNMVFQLISNNSEFLTYSYMAYGIKEAEYKKIMNIVSLPLQARSKEHTYSKNTNYGTKHELKFFIIFTAIASYFIVS